MSECKYIIYVYWKKNMRCTRAKIYRAILFLNKNGKTTNGYTISSMHFCYNTTAYCCFIVVLCSLTFFHLCTQNTLERQSNILLSANSDRSIREWLWEWSLKQKKKKNNGNIYFNFVKRLRRWSIKRDHYFNNRADIESNRRVA